ncbi:MAG TPA: DUF3300 domain-containing protein [Pyrinomonadaceae bacterium]|nr:DUF3300 domain-containing protein [Pyrinomonadaceae bacterium]
MKKIFTLCLLSCLVGNMTLASAATRRSANPAPAAVVAEGLSAEQMDNLLAPIALYPDPLLAQVFPASTFVDQVEQAARWLRGNNNQTTGVDNQSWDVSVKSVAHYPQVVYMMSDKLDWTTALGQAYVNQSTEVLTSVQRLRARAKSAGYLISTPQQTVIVEKEVIKVVPAQPQVIYVPTYNPQVVYVQPPPSGPSTGQVVAATAIAFGAGLAIGAWLNNDCNWHTHTVYYHGWHGSGWISTSVHHVHVNSVYVNRSYTNVHVNRTVVNRNVNYNNINHYNNVNRNVNYNNVNVNNVNRNNVNVNNVNRNNVNTNNVNTNNVNRNNVANKNINTNDARINSMRGQTNSGAAGTRPAQPAQQRSSAFSRGGSSAGTSAASQRGQASRASARESRSAGGGGRSGGGRRH